MPRTPSSRPGIERESDNQSNAYDIKHSTYGGVLATPSQGSFCYYLVMEQNGSKRTAAKGEPPRRLGLTEEFRAQASWGDGSREQEPKREPEKDGGVALVRLMRSIDPEDYARRCNWLEAINLEHTEEDYSKCVRENHEYMRDRLYELRPPALDFIHAGRAIVEKAGLEIESAVVQNYLHLTKADPDIDVAFYSAITSAVNSSPGPADWDTIALALATFVHSLPHFKSIVEPGEFHQPFGDKTGWRMAKKAS